VSRAIKRRHGNRIADAFCRIQLLDSRLGVIGGVSPVTRGIDGQAAVGAAQCLCLERGLASIRIGCVEYTRGADIISHHGDVFLYCAGIITSDNGCIVGVVNG